MTGTGDYRLAPLIVLALAASACDDGSSNEPAPAPPPVLRNPTPAVERPRPDPAPVPSAAIAPNSPTAITSYTGLADGGYLPTKSREAVDGSPFVVPDPLPDACRPISCDVPPPEEKSGIVVRVLMHKGMGPGELAYPRAIAAARDGSSYYVVDKMGRVQRLDADLHVRAVAQTPEIDRGKPTGLSVAPNGELWVADTHYARVLVYSPTLALQRSWGVPGSRNGQFLFLRDVKEAGGRILAADYGDDVARVQIFSAEGTFASSFGHFGDRPGEFQRPMKVAVDLERKELWVADSVNHRLQVLDLDGKPLKTIGGLGDEQGCLKYPYDVVLDEDGRAWVAEFGNHRIQVFDREGRSLAVWGRAGRGAGEIAYPWGVAIEPERDGKRRVLVIDSGNDRIYELDRNLVLAGAR